VAKSPLLPTVVCARLAAQRPEWPRSGRCPRSGRSGRRPRSGHAAEGREGRLRSSQRPQTPPAAAAAAASTAGQQTDLRRRRAFAAAAAARISGRSRFQAPTLVLPRLSRSLLVKEDVLLLDSTAACVAVVVCLRVRRYYSFLCSAYQHCLFVPQEALVRSGRRRGVPRGGAGWPLRPTSPSNCFLSRFCYTKIVY
jgi:hypothetical protein